MDVTQLGQDTFTGTAAQAIAHLQNLAGNENVLVITQNDFPSNTLTNFTGVLSTLEDWSAAICYRLADISVNTQKTERLLEASIENRSLDNGFYRTNEIYLVHPVTVRFYTLDTSPTRPSPSQI